MLRTCVAAADTDGTVSVFLEPIALYHTRDLHEAGRRRVDGAVRRHPQRWADEHVPIGDGRVVSAGDDLLIVTWANGLYLSLRAARRLAGHGISCRVFDLRWLAPLPIDQIVAHADEIGRVLVVDETRHSGGVGEAVAGRLSSNNGYRGVAHGVSPPATRSFRSATRPIWCSSARTTSSTPSTTSRTRP